MTSRVLPVCLLLSVGVTACSSQEKNPFLDLKTWTDHNLHAARAGTKLELPKLIDAYYLTHKARPKHPNLVYGLWCSWYY